MKAIGILFLLLLTAAPALGQVNGHLEQIDGKYVLTVWGTHVERGYAQGYLLGEQGKIVFDDYFVDFFCYGSSYVYGYLRELFESDFAVDEKYRQESESMILGMVDAGVDLYNAVLNRDIDATDILVTNAIVDLSQVTGRDGFGCSSLSSWGGSTAADPILDGHLVITRLLDWSKHPTLTDNPALIVHFPAEADEAPWLSISYAGFIGALSSVCESGLAAFLNMGNNSAGETGLPYQPILLTLRSGMELADYDQDGSKTAADVAAAITDRSRAGGTIIHVTADEGPASDPIVIECNNANGVAQRDRSHNSVIPGDNLAATNHFRVLYAPVFCPRYEAIADSLQANGQISPARSWSLMAGAAGSFYGNIQAMQYIQSAGRLDWAVDSDTEPAYMQQPSTFFLDELFSPPTHIETAAAPLLLEQNFPNPFNPRTSIRFALPLPANCRLTVHDPQGRRVRTLAAGAFASGRHRIVWDGRDEAGYEVSSGLYYYLLDDGSQRTGRKMLLLK